jgi:hypothetical protein
LSWPQDFVLERVESRIAKDAKYADKRWFVYETTRTPGVLRGWVDNDFAVVLGTVAQATTTWAPRLTTQAPISQLEQLDVYFGGSGNGVVSCTHILTDTQINRDI